MYEEYNDYELLNYIAENNEEANNIIYKKYEPLIFSNAKKMINYISNSGVEINDLVQEGMLGLSKAIESFKDSKEAMFYTYARTCIKRKMIDLIISTKRLKHKALNDSISIDGSIEDGVLDYLIPDNSSNPEEILLNEEKQKEINNQAKSILTILEFQVFELKKNGFNNKEIAEILDLEYKQVDNALKRIKGKLKKEIFK